MARQRRRMLLPRALRPQQVELELRRSAVALMLTLTTRPSRRMYPSPLQPLHQPFRLTRPSLMRRRLQWRLAQMLPAQVRQLSPTAGTIARLKERLLAAGLRPLHRPRQLRWRWQLEVGLGQVRRLQPGPFPLRPHPHPHHRHPHPLAQQRALSQAGRQALVL